jgi:hypothetical protein
MCFAPCNSVSGSARDYFFVWVKTSNGAFLGIFQRGRDLFDPSKISQKSPILRFAHEKKIISLTFRISITLIVNQDSSSIFSSNMNSRSGGYANTFKKGKKGSYYPLKSFNRVLATFLQGTKQ